MNRDDHLNNCAKHLGRLECEIRALNAMGRFDINSVAEDFLIPILGPIFDCPELQNQNQIHQNFPSVDLGCKKSRMSFQVTTDASSEKATKTLEKFREHGLENDFDHVFIITITDKQSSYSAKSLLEAIAQLPVAFDPTKNILDLRDISSRIRGLETDKLERIEAYLASEFCRREKHLRFGQELDKFVQFSQSKIEVEKKSKKYIPSIFVETHRTKEEVRFFANPLFFYRKVQDVLRRIDYTRLNSLLGLAKEPELVLELDSSAMLAAPTTFTELEVWAKGAEEMIDRELKRLRPLSWDREEGQGKYVPLDEDSAAWSIARVQIESAANGMYRRLKDGRAQLQLMRKKIFLITSMAGQGKTNFVCDLVENQFRRFEIPCVFIPARELNGYPSRQRLFGFISNNRYAPAVANMHEYLRLFNEVAAESGKPFLIVIDGINEVTALDEFNDELKDFCNAVCQYDHVKVIITCRSEFFDEKYASILNEPFSCAIHRVADLRSEMSERSKDRLLRSYLKHFKVTGQPAGAAEKFLKNDLLLLRIFCERFEGREVGYTTDIYKGDLFEDFLVKKVESFPEHLQGKALPTLFKIVSAMLAADDYSKLSVRDFSAEERDVVLRLVADDVILRQEISGKDLGGLGDLVISFTYDELRDFVIAYKLIADDNVESLEQVLSCLRGRPILEGVYRYVYLLARKANKTSAIEACERADAFIEHFTLNVHLLPPAVQNPADVARIKASLADTSVPRRVRHAAMFLLSRRNLAELLNITILIEHLNGLEAENHKAIVRAIFSDPNDFGWRDWQVRVDELVQDVWNVNSDRGLAGSSPEWLAFFLHASSHANWSERERASSLFRSLRGEANIRDALGLVSSAESPAIRSLLGDIEEPEEEG